MNNMKNLKNMNNMKNVVKSVIFYAGFFSLLLGVISEGPVMLKALFVTIGAFCMIGTICSIEKSNDISDIFGGKFFNMLFNTEDFTKE